MKTSGERKGYVKLTQKDKEEIFATFKEISAYLKNLNSNFVCYRRFTEHQKNGYWTKFWGVPESALDAVLKNTKRYHPFTGCLLSGRRHFKIKFTKHTTTRPYRTNSLVVKIVKS